MLSPPVTSTYIFSSTKILLGHPREVEEEEGRGKGDTQI